MECKPIIIKDHLRKAGYTWPPTLLGFILPEEEAATQMAWLSDTNGDAVPFQWRQTDTAMQLCLVADLPTGAERRFEWRCGGAPTPEMKYGQVTVARENGSVQADNGRLTVRFAEGALVDGELFTFRLDGFGAEGVARINSGGHKLLAAEGTVTAAGPVFAECEFICHFEGDGEYRAIVTIAEGMDYIELREQMSGCTAGENAMLLIEWRSFAPTHRYIKPRGAEPIDQYLDGNGDLPFRVKPYDNAVCWQQAKGASFTDGAVTAGVFVKDGGYWDDGEYALWGSPQSLALRFRWSKRRRTLRWEYPLADGRRCTAIALYPSQREAAVSTGSYIDELWLWHELLSLDKVKDWTLAWEERQSDYPRLFREERLPQRMHTWFGYSTAKPTPGDMEAIVDRLSFCFHNPSDLSPVAAREFYTWASTFDLAARAMTADQFDRLKAAWAFMAYTHNEESFMPVVNMLAGHPNFLVDVRSVPALMAALFPAHPDARRWKEDFERAMALNAKYHVRPDVASWGTKGGRHTENLACYTLYNLKAMLSPVIALQRVWGEHTMAYPNYAKWLSWLLNALTAPVEGFRHVPSQGAHAGGHVDDYAAPLTLRSAGYGLRAIEPLLAEHLMYVSPADARIYAERVPNTDIWRGADDAPHDANTGTRPSLHSSAYTGYGFVLRAAVGESAEASVHLQQIDEGPNYRWGRAGQGGCGVITYYANGKRLSFNRKEDVGDDNMGDVQACCNFGVLYGHEFRSVGRSELTEPLLDLGFAQFARVLAGPYANPAYHSRSVLMSGSDYMIIYDQVGDMRVRGRFAWFVHERDAFPTICQLKPGVTGYDAVPGIPAEVGSGAYRHVNDESKGKYYDGNGHFLTLVSPHGKGDYGYLLSTQATAYGALVVLNDRRDFIFRDEAAIAYNEGDISFMGHSGLVRHYCADKVEAALFIGSRIGAAGVVLQVAAVGKEDEEAEEMMSAGFSFIRNGPALSGRYSSRGGAVLTLTIPESLRGAAYRIYVDGTTLELLSADESGISFQLPAGLGQWEWTDRLPIPGTVQIIGYRASSGAADLIWEPVEGAESYEIVVSEDGGANWTVTASGISSQLEDTALPLRWRLTGTNGTKRHVRIRAINRDREGAWSEDYPVYMTGESPERADGLRVTRTGSGYRLTWGWQLGVTGYRLYRRERDEGRFIVVYEGESPVYEDTNVDPDCVYEYCITACNGNGEGAASPLRDTALGGLADWDPRPDEDFRRYTRSHEYGYHGFDHWANESKSVLTYPKPDDIEEEDKV
ncbi:fibronectin type III domain-containing protein [Paenibacillus qinlingensis]|uniref:fibronectin type III domain-containing protein n=1 Tax=Paenibacillus qinlingensis TaxID=1837343 RepID=UPI00156363A5|nr:fibronectin type III domain-containing protein [Paenibacillus qinlingensis]NQX60525.1 fibronectin type III domain-containing protein [Paenibacillus qinlingensis]